MILIAEIKKTLLYFPPAIKNLLLIFQSIEDTVPGILKPWIRDISYYLLFYNLDFITVDLFVIMTNL